MTASGPVTGTEDADVVVMAASAIETVRLALLSSFPDVSGKLGRRLMFHAFIDGTAIFLDERMHAYRGRSVTQCVEDAVDPDFPGARAFARAHGLPYLRGGLMELGGSQDPISEAQSYQTLLSLLGSARPFGTEFKQLMRASLLRDRLAGCSFIGHDLPYLDHTVTLDSKVKDVFGLPVARITWSAGPHEQVAQDFWIPRLKQMMLRAGAGVALAVPGHGEQRRPADRQPHHGRHDDGAGSVVERDRRLRPGARTGQRVRGRRLGLCHLGRAQPDQHDPGRGPAQHAPPGRDAATGELRTVGRYGTWAVMT